MPIRLILIITLISVANFSTANTINIKDNLTVADFLEDPDVYDAEFSPDGRYLATISRKADEHFLVILDFDSEGIPITGTLKSRYARPISLSWANNERLLVNLAVPIGLTESKFLSELEKDPDFNIRTYQMAQRTVAMNTSAKELVVLMDNMRYARRNTSLSQINNYMVNDDKHVIMPALGYRSLELHKVNVYTGKSKRIVKGSRRTYQYLTDENGRPTYRFDYYYYGKRIRIYEYTEDDSWNEIDEVSFIQDDEESFFSDTLVGFGFGENNALIYRERNPETGFYEIIRRERGRDTTEIIASHKDKDIHSAIFDSRTNKYLGYRIQDDLIRDVYSDEEWQKHYDQIAKDIGHSNFSVWASRKHGKRVVINASSADNPGSFYMYDYTKMALSFLDDKRRKFSVEKMALPATIYYKTRDGLKIRMYVLLPPGYKQGTAYPMVILPHGGPHVRDSSAYDEFAQFISTRGYIVIKPNFRGSSGYGQKFEEAGYKQWGLLMQDDLVDAVNFMIKKGFASADRVCIVGGSYGGYAALMGAIKTPELYQCSVSINGVTHLKDQIEHDIDSARINEDKIEEFVHKTIGDPKKDAVMLDANSPALHAKSIKIPLMIFAGEDDSIVPVEQSRMMVEALEEHNKSYQYFELEDTAHDVFYYKEDVRKVYTEVARFLEKHLKK